MDSTATATPDAPPADRPAAGAPAPTTGDRRLGPRFRTLLVASGASNLGDGILMVAVPLVAIGFTRAPGEIGLLTAATWLPWLLVGIVAGVVVDRTDRRRAQMVALTARAALLAGAAWLAVSGGLTLTWLLVIVLAYGTTEVFADLAANALVPDLVTAEQLPTANGRIVSVQEVTNTFLGSPVSGALLALGTGWALGVPAALAVLAVLVLWRGLPGRYSHAPARTSGEATPGAVRHALADVRDGLALVLRHRVLRPLVLAGALVNLTSTAYISVFVLWVVGPGSRVGVPATVYPVLLTLAAVGAVLGSTLVGPVLARTGEVRAMVGSWTVAFGTLALPVLVPHPVAIGAALLVMGTFSTIGNVVSQSVRQRIVPREMLGRTGGATRTLVFGLMPVGALLGGVVAERWGIATTLVGATAAALAVAAGLAVAMRGVTPADLAAPQPGTR